MKDCPADKSCITKQKDCKHRRCVRYQNWFNPYWQSIQEKFMKVEGI